MSWAQRLKRVFNIDIQTCRACGGAVKVIACIEDPVVIKSVFAPNSQHRALVTPTRGGKGNKAAGPDEPPAQRQPSMSWAQHLKRVFHIDIETCRQCGEAVKVIACIEDPAVTKQILAHLQHKAEAGEPRVLPESRAPSAGLAQGLFD